MGGSCIEGTGRGTTTTSLPFPITDEASVSFTTNVMGSRSRIEKAGTETGRGHRCERSLLYLMRCLGNMRMGAKGDMRASSWVAVGMTEASTARPLAGKCLFCNSILTNCCTRLAIQSSEIFTSRCSLPDNVAVARDESARATNSAV
jgi:hypothetical protein